MCIQRKKAEDKNLEFKVIYKNIKDTVSNEDTFSPIIKTDEHRVMQVLLGLQSNALKFTTNGRVIIMVEIEIRDKVSYLKISVQDTGVGIPAIE